jgi:poly-gamma-glutamate synthesis protein (capsule biosynthesis protein)
MDYGEAGLIESLVRIGRFNLQTVGAGKTKKEAQSPVFFDWNKIRIGILARCEIQFGVATDVSSGVAGFDASIYSQIKNLKQETDIVIVSIHAAAEMFPWPSPRRRDVWRSLIDAGADIVHGHHSHVPQGWEKYGNGLICYGLGNFCVDPKKWRWHPDGLWSLAPELSLKSDGLEMMPKTTVIDDLGDRIRIRDARADESAYHQRYLVDCNRPLSDPRLLEGLWQDVSVRMYKDCYSDWLGFNFSLKNDLRWFAGKLFGD